MCKFLALENQTNYLLNKKESFQEKVQRAHILELENKKLEDSLIKKCEQHKSTKATKSHKLGELLKKLKTLDEITFLLEEKNKTNEDLMRKQNRMLREFKEKYKKTLKENQEIKNENEKLKTKVEELERNLEKISKENDQIKGITLHTKVSELGTEDLELNQSLSSDYEFFRNNLRPESRIRALSNLPLSLEKPNLRKNETNMAQDFEDNDEFRNSVSSERNSFVSNEINTTASLIKQMEDAKKKSKSVLRKTFLYYNQIKLAKLQQNLAVGKLF